MTNTNQNNININVKIEDVEPIEEDNKRCGPHLTFHNGSCIDLDLLKEMAISYNTWANENNKKKIKVDDFVEKQYPDEYKRYLLLEFIKRFGNNQKKWINEKFVNNMSENSMEDLKNHVFRPDGPQERFEWLSTIDINRALEQYEKKYEDFKFFGAVPIDFEELDYLPFKDADFKELFGDKKRFGMIFNLDKHNEPGSHWVSLYFDITKGHIYFSDSYGSVPAEQITSFINKIKKFLKENGISEIDYRYNKTQHQKGGSECGVYSINFILRLLKGKTFDHITRKRVKDEKVNQCRLVYFGKTK